MGKRLQQFGAALLAIVLALPAAAANEANEAYPAVYVPAAPMATLNIPPIRPRMSPELALNTYEADARWQALQLGESDDTTTITADLPDAAKHGQYRLKRVYSAPRTLAFKTIDFVGDGFVKSNVIFRLLQSEAEHVKKDQPGDTAITRANYKFSYKGTQVVNGRVAHVFQVKPRQKRAGLFRGTVYIDAYTAGMVRAEGRVVKSPSLFIRSIDFVQDYAQVGDFNLIAHIHSVADTRLIGRAVVDITHNDYQVRTMTEVVAQAHSTPRVITASYRENAQDK
jgi:hypothetical protein